MKQHVPATRDGKRHDPHCWPLLPPVLLFFSSSSSDFWPRCRRDVPRFRGPSGQPGRKTSKPRRRLRHSGTASLLAASTLPGQKSEPNPLKEVSLQHRYKNETSKCALFTQPGNPQRPKSEAQSGMQAGSRRSCCCPCGRRPSLLCRLPVIHRKLTAQTYRGSFDLLRTSEAIVT